MLRKSEKKRGGKKKIQRDRGRLDELREDYGVGQRAEHGLNELGETGKTVLEIEEMDEVDMLLKRSNGGGWHP